LDTIVSTAREVISRTAADDRLWLVTADGIPRRQTRLEVFEALDGLVPSTGRLDLGRAVRAAALAIEDDQLPNGPVVIVSDLQRTALSRGSTPDTRVLAWEPPTMPANRWLDSVYSQPEVWTPGGGVVAVLDGTPDRPVTLRLRSAGVELARSLASPGDRVVLSGTLPRTGWTTVSVELDPDEMRADDQRTLALYRAEPAAFRPAPDIGGFLEDALAVLQEGGRAVPGDMVSVGQVSQIGASVVFPPSDPALVGALNRTLDSYQVGWRFEEIVVGEWELSDMSGTADGMAVYRRYRLSGTGDVYATVAGEPWLVRSENVLLVASRMEPEWTRLPISAAFVPFVDFLVNRMAAKETWIVTANPGETVELPVSARTMHAPHPGGVTTVSSDRRVLTPRSFGVYFLCSAAGDTVGALEVNADHRESRLQTADQSQIRGAFGGNAQLLESPVLFRELFRGPGRTSLAGLFLLATLVAVLGEFLVASSGGQTRSAG
jgi:hypothetical protein